jgi:putative endopeptidase
MTATEPQRSGLDLDWLDPDVRPQDDLYAHVNGRWQASYAIPEDRSQDGAFRMLADRAQGQVREIVEDCASGSSQPGTDARRVGDLFASFMDTDRIERLGVEPLRPLLDEIAGATDRTRLAAVLGRRQRDGRAVLFGGFVATDLRDPHRYLVNLEQGGLGLPDESYYRDDDSAGIRTAYVEYLERLAGLVGLSDPARVAEQVMDLETALADAAWDQVSNRDAGKTYTLMTRDELRATAPGFDWSAWETALGVPSHAYDELIVRQPSFVAEAGRLWAERPLEQWQAWLALRVAASCSEHLSSELVETDFDFYGRTLSGTPELAERWRRGVALVEASLGDAVGQIYVERHFPPQAKERIEGLVATVIEAYRQSISTVDWMGPGTRERALDKLGRFTPKVGYPERWKDYSALTVWPDDLLGNVGRAAQWRHDHEYAKLGGPVDRDEWLSTPQTVNAYYNPRMNEIVFPAAILQPPFFDADADDAVNYGGIGSTIGHEIGHGFDDQGSRYDGDGVLTDWWDAADRGEFESRAQMLIDQYDRLSPAGLPDHTVNGALTVGENLGDLGGLTISLKAYRIACGDTAPPVLDGLTGDQRALIGWARIWRAVTREEEAIRRLATDPHSPPDLRCNAVVSNLDAFHEAFDVGEDDAMYRPPHERVRVW